MGIIRGMRFYATSQSERYDSLYSLQYNDESFRYSKLNNPSGVNPTFNFPYHSEHCVLEYKYDLNALIRDFAAEIKLSNHINLVVCWKAIKQFREN